MILDAVRESGGVAIATPEPDIAKWMQIVSSMEGILICPETAVCYSALESLLQSGFIKKEERTLIFNTAAAQKYLQAFDLPLPRIDLTKAIDWTAI